MSITASVNYHVASTEDQAFHIDAAGVEGKLVSPVLVPTEIAVRDVRTDGASVDFASDGVAFLRRPSGIEDLGYGRDWKSGYDDELRGLLGEVIGARETIVFDHTVRTDDPNAARKPAAMCTATTAVAVRISA